MALELNGVPSWKVTFGRSLNVHSVASEFDVHDSARAGTSWLSVVFHWRRPSYTLRTTANSSTSRA